MKDLADMLQYAFLEYLNDYLTVERFAADKGIGEDEASSIILAGRNIHNARNP